MSSANRPDKVARFIELSHEISSHTRSHMAAEWPEHELSMPQFKLLVLLSGGRLRMGDLARMLEISLSSATNLVGRLEAKGLVQRDHDFDDRRVVTCELTGEGRSTVHRFWAVGEKGAEEITRQLSDDEFDLVLTAFELLARASRRPALEVTDRDE
jgi:DNA-binding MarR family transcriptional regulator